MKPMWLVMTLPLLAAGCVSAPRDSAICDGLTPWIDKHAAALVRDGGDESVVTGQNLVAKFDAACAGRGAP